jgi:hypothetical protein
MAAIVPKEAPKNVRNQSYLRASDIQKTGYAEQGRAKIQIKTERITPFG